MSNTNGNHASNGQNGTAIIHRAPILKGTTQFPPHHQVKNILITGGAGFIASWVARHLTLTYPHYNIVSFDKLDYCSTLNNTAILNSEPNFSFYHGDLTKPSQVLECMEQHKIDTVLHFAAQSHVDLSFGNSYSFTHDNVYGTHVLLESSKKMRVKRFIHVSTDEVYGEVKEHDDELLETSILAPTNPYAASKAAAEMLVQSYQKSFKLPCIIVRSNNVYGPHQYPEKIIPKFTCLLHRNRPLVLHGSGKPTRRYLYASDAVDAFDTILHVGHINQIYNVGSSDEVSNLQLCAKLLSLFNLTSPSTSTSSSLEDSSSPFDSDDFRKWVKYTHDRPFNDHRYAVDATKLRKLGWSQKTDLDDGLRQTVDWYVKYGEEWWGDISHVLTPFPVVTEGHLLPDIEHLLRDDPVFSRESSVPVDD